MINFKSLDRASISNYLKSHYRKVVIVLLSLSIMMMLWYLRSPLSEKYLKTNPKTYSISSFDPKKLYVVTQKDFLIGSLDPQDQMIIVIFEQKGNIKLDQKKIPTGKNGMWTYQFPEKIRPGRYVLATGVQHLDKSITTTSMYQINLQSDNLAERNTLYQLLFSSPR